MMWALKDRTSYASERNWTRDKEGVHLWVVAVRATFDVAPGGRLTLADEQPPPVLGPVYVGEPGKSSLRYESDLLEVKPSTDVLILAHAHAPGGHAAATVPVSLRFDSIEKHLLVHGERAYYEGGLGVTTTAPLPFTSRPIRYEFAFGGSDLADPDPHNHAMDERNPIGRGFARRQTSLLNTPAHAIEYPHGDASTKGPAGFGPIDRAWLPRRRLAGTYDANWFQTKRPLLPDDYDPAFALSAPADQRLARPAVGGELIELINMTPEGALRLQIPRISLGFITHIAGRREEHAATLTTVLAEPEERRLSLVWQSSLRVHALDAEYLDETEIFERRGAA